MVKTISCMNKSTFSGAFVREARFRTPGPPEKALGLWVDRVGTARERGGKMGGPRILGQFAAVAVEAGSGVLRRPGRADQPLRQGDVIWLTPEAVCGYGSGSGWRQSWVVWNGPEARLAGRMALGLESEVVRGAATRVSAARESLEPLLREEGVAAALRRKGIVLELVAELAERQQHGQVGRSAQARVAAAAEAMRREFRTGLSVDALARRAGLSPTHFRRVFRDVTGWTPRRYLVGLRVAHGAELLSAGLSVQEAAARSGFSDPFHFSRTFKQVRGMAPARFAAEAAGC